MCRILCSSRAASTFARIPALRPLTCFVDSRQPFTRPHPLLAGDRSMPRLPHVGLPLSIFALTALCACSGQVAERPEDDTPVLRGGEVTAALNHDESAPLHLMPVPERAAGFVEHEVKKIPRNFNTAKAPDP